jgi:hypothetical protein
LFAQAGIGIELWNMQSSLEFDNFYVGTDLGAAMAFAQHTFARKSRREKEQALQQDFLERVLLLCFFSLEGKHNLNLLRESGTSTKHFSALW